FFSHPLEIDQVVAAVFEAVDVGETFDKARFDQLLNQFDPQPFDVHRGPRGVEANALTELRGAAGVRTADGNAPLVLHGGRMALGAFCREVKVALGPVAAVLFDTDDVRDDLSRLFYDDPIADLHSQPRQLIAVVQAGAGDGGPRNFDGTQVGDRG